MDASHKALYDRFLAMGFTPDPDNDMILRHPNFGPANGFDNSILFADGYIECNINNAVEEHIIEHVKLTIMGVLKNGPFNGYERYRIKFDEWSVTDDVIGAYISCDALNLPPQKHRIIYKLITQECIIEPSNFPNLVSLVDEYGKIKTPAYEDHRTKVLQKITAAGFEQISERAFIHPKYPAYDTYDNIFTINWCEINLDTCCPEMYMDIMRLFIRDAAFAAAVALQDYKKYGIVLSDWSFERGCLVSKLKCNGMRMFAYGEIAYNPFGDSQVLYIEDERYPDLEYYVFSRDNIRKIMNTLAGQFKQMEYQISTLTQQIDLLKQPGGPQ